MSFLRDIAENRINTYAIYPFQFKATSPPATLRILNQYTQCPFQEILLRIALMLMRYIHFLFREMPVLEDQWEEYS